MMEEKKGMHADGCVCESGMAMKMDGYKHKHRMMKFAVGVILLFIAFWVGVQLGEIKGALGMTPQYSHYEMMRGGMNQGQTLYGSY